MATKKKAKGVLETIGDAVSAGTEAVIDAGAKAIHAVGDLMPAAKPAPKRAKVKPGKAAAATKTARSARPATPKVKAKSSEVHDKAVATKATATKTRTAPKAASPKTSAPKKSAPKVAAKPTEAKSLKPITPAKKKAASKKK